MFMSEINALFDLLQKTAAWLQPIVAGPRKKEEKEAAYVLKEATVLVEALQLLSNSWRKAIGQLLLFTPDWTMEQREQARQEITGFLLEEVYIPEIAKARSALAWYYESHLALTIGKWLRQLPNLDGDTIGTIMDAGQDIYYRVWRAESTPMSFIGPYMTEMLNASSDEEARIVRGTAEDLLGWLADARKIARAQEALGTLRAAILSNFPSLPRPDW